MIRPLSTFGRLRPPKRRVAALDPGSRCLKLLLAESEFGRVRIQKQEMIDLKAEGLVSAEEIKAHLLDTLDGWGSPPLALVLPQHLSISQLIDVPVAPESEIKKLIEDELVRLSGASESKIVYDFIRTDAIVKNRQRFWVTLAQEGEIRERIVRLGLDQEDLSEVTTTANALIAAYGAAASSSRRAILVHMGAQTTVVVVLLGGQGAFATSFQMGGDFLTRALARARNCSEEAAEALKRGTNLMNGPAADPRFVEAVDGWAAELKRQLKDWLERHPLPEGDKAGVEFVASGGGFEQPGLIEHLKTHAGLNLRPWPSNSAPGTVQPAKGFKVAFGAALQALGCSAQSVSLLPEDYRVAWRKRQGQQRLEFASLLLLGICLLLFAVGTWHNLSLIGRKEALLTKVQSGQEAVEANDALTADLVAEYETLRPFFAAQQGTIDTLKTLSLLQQSRSNRSCWYVLIADQQSYFSQPASLSPTNRAGRTNAIGAPLPPLTPFSSFTASWMTFTNPYPPRPGLIAELCIPEEAEAARRLLGQIVAGLQHQRLFAKVDLLSEDLRRGLADPKVVLPDRQFVLALDFAETDFQKAPVGKRGFGGSPPRGGRRTTRPSSSAAENPDNLSPNGR